MNEKRISFSLDEIVSITACLVNSEKKKISVPIEIKLDRAFAGKRDDRNEPPRIFLSEDAIFFILNEYAKTYRYEIFDHQPEETKVLNKLLSAMRNYHWKKGQPKNTKPFKKVIADYLKRKKAEQKGTKKKIS